MALLQPQLVNLRYISFSVVFGPPVGAILMVPIYLVLGNLHTVQDFIALLALAYLFGFIPSLFSAVLFGVMQKMFKARYVTAGICGWVATYVTFSLYGRNMTIDLELIVLSAFMGGGSGLIIYWIATRWLCH